jgi:hypothetical protein
VVSSNLGQIILLGGVTFLLHLVEEDLRLAGTFADFLHKSNMAFTKNNVAEYSIQESQDDVANSRGYLSNSISNSNDKDKDNDNGDIEMTEKGEMSQQPDYLSTTPPGSSSSSHLLSITKRMIATKESKYQMEIEECRSFDTIYSGDLKDDFGRRGF